MKPKQDAGAGADGSKVSRPKDPTKGGAASKPTATERKKEAAFGSGSKDAADGGQAVKKEATERPRKKEAAATVRPPKKEPAAAERPVKKDAAAVSKKEAAAASEKEEAGERLGARLAASGDQAAKGAAAADRQARKEATAGSVKGAGDKLSKPRPQPDANGRPAKPAAAQRAGQAAKAAAAVKQEQQQEHAGSNPSSLQREGGTAGDARQQQQQITSPPRPAPIKAEPGSGAGRASVGTPVEVLAAPSGPASHVGELPVVLYNNHDELWKALRSDFGGGLQHQQRMVVVSASPFLADRVPAWCAVLCGWPGVRVAVHRDGHLLLPLHAADKLPPNGKARLLYQDSDGDWLLLQPEAPWPLFTRTVRKLVVMVPAAGRTQEETRAPKLES